jgi:3-phenylpropionate/trans-cinnamate dioxygenase ferredoxin reductase component
MSDRFDLLVVGAGPAGFSTVRAYRDAGGTGAVGLVTDEGTLPYNRPPLTKDLLRGESSEEDLPLVEESWLHEQRVAMLSGRAVALDAEARTLTLSGGRELAYSVCVLATGAEPKRLPVPGADDLLVRVLRTISDLRELLRRLEPGDPVVVVGSGFIGSEIAASLRMRGHPVTLISDEPAPNQARLGAEPAQELAHWLEEAGVSLMLDTPVERIEHDQRGCEVTSGSARATGALVVMAAGVAPRSELAAGAGAGLELADGAVPVDGSMRADGDGSLLACGDVARAFNSAAGRPLQVEHWGDALGHGKVAGQTAAGHSASWSDVPGFWSTIGKRTLKYAAWGDGFDELRVERHSGGGFTAWYGREGRLVGVLAHQADEDYEHGRELIKAGAPWRS